MVSNIHYICCTKFSAMFNQVVGSGANIFLIIVAVLVGFAAGLSFVDFKREKKKEQPGEH